MRKIIYCFPFLLCLTFSSCGNKINVNKINEEENKTGQADLWKNQYCYTDSQLVSATTNTYNEKGFLVNQIEWKINKDKSKTKRNYMKYEYNQAGLITASHLCETEYGELKNTISHLTEYDSHNNVIKEVDVENCVMNQAINYSYVYDENNNIVEKNVETFGAKSGLNKRKRYFYSYDNDNRPISGTIYTWERDFTDPSMANIAITKSVYDKNKITETKYWMNYGYEYITKQIVVSEYNDMQKLKYGIIYDYYYTIGKTEELRTKSEIYCDYDEYGNLRSRTKYTSNPGSGVFTLNEEVDNYTYCGRNHDKILSSMHVVTNIHKINQTENEKSTFTAINNYYDDKERLVKSESLSGGNSVDMVTTKTIVNEY